MGIDAGFDMVPRLSQGSQDKQDWEKLINFIQDYYKDDPQVEIKPHWIEFHAGEHPMLPFQGHKFLRFSSKVSGPTAYKTGVERYIDMVTRVAKTIFGSRVQYWHEAGERYGFYGWDEVNRSIASYQDSNELEPQPLSVTTEPRHGTAANLHQTLFKVEQIPGKGRGLVALCDIAKGTRIVCEKPLFIIESMPLELLEGVIATKLKALSKEQQRQFISLHNNHHHLKPFTGIFKTNGLSCGPDSTTGAVYPTICLINHSCFPNTQHNWNGDNEVETIHAVKLIKAGEEITINYSSGDPSHIRQTRLRQSFGFDCHCNLCSLPTQELELSDARRLEIQRLDEAIGDPMRMMSRPGASLAGCRRLAQVLEEEFAGATTILTARVNYDAFQICAVHSDRTRASVFAEKAYKVRLICEGEDSPDTTRMKRLMENPSSHPNFGAYSKKWKGSEKFSPSSLNAEEFEAWLWRHAN